MSPLGEVCKAYRHDGEKNRSPVRRCAHNSTRHTKRISPMILLLIMSMKFTYERRTKNVIPVK